MEGGDARIGENLAAAGLDDLAKAVVHQAVIHNAGLRHEQPGDAGGVRLVFADLPGGQAADAFQALALELLERGAAAEGEGRREMFPRGGEARADREPTVEQARERADRAVDLIDWPQGFCRRDIAWRAVGRRWKRCSTRYAV